MSIGLKNLSYQYEKERPYQEAIQRRVCPRETWAPSRPIQESCHR